MYEAVTQRRWDYVLTRLKGWRALALCLSLLCAPTALADEKLDSLTIDGNTFSNVTVIMRTSTHISFKHAHGFASVKLSTLPAKEQTKVGYTPPPPPKTFIQRGKEATEPYVAWLNDPRVRQLEQELRAEVNRIIIQNDTTLIYPAIGGAVCVYFLICLAVVKICRKTTVRAGLWAWLPGLQFVALLKAAGMSPWLYPLVYIPVANIILLVIWSVKICRTRQKNPALAFFLMPWMIPVNIFVFFYLAFSSHKTVSAPRSQPGKLKLSFQH